MINDQLADSDSRGVKNLYSNLRDTKNTEFFVGSKHKPDPISVREFVTVGMRNTFNLT